MRLNTAFLALLIIAASAPTARARKWTDSTGQFTREAELQDFRSSNVWLKDRDGKSIVIPFEKLSEADQDYVVSRGRPAGSFPGGSQSGSSQAPPAWPAQATGGELRRAPPPPDREMRESRSSPRTQKKRAVFEGVTIEQYYDFLVEQLFETTGKRDVPRTKSFNPSDWAGTRDFVRIERAAVPIFDEPGWGRPTINIRGIAQPGELLALLETRPVSIFRGLWARTPDSSGTWCKVRLLDGEEGWLCAVPAGREASPFAKLVKRGENGQFFDARLDQGTPASQPIEDARLRGADAGQADGARAGDADGFAMGFKSGEESSYAQTLSELCSSGNYRRVTKYSFLVVSIAFLLGFTLQYGAVHLLRGMGFGDIDGILLPRRAAAISLKDLSEYGNGVPSSDEHTEFLRSDPT